MDYEKLVPCQLRELNLSCFGCCGNEFSSKEEILEEIEENSKEFSTLGKKPSKDELKSFRDRYGKQVLSQKGLCYSLVDFGKGCVGCPLHQKVKEILPKSSNLTLEIDEDLRIGECDVNYECDTFKYWKLMSLSQREDFVKWVKEKEFSNYDYSIENIEGRLIRLFFEEMGWSI